MREQSELTLRYKKITVLSHIEQTKLLTAFAASPDPKEKERIRNMLVLSNLPFIFSVAKQYVRKDFPMEDIVHETVFGFMRAIKKFDASRNTSLRTYAKWWMVSAINHAQQGKYHIIKIDGREWLRIHRVIEKMAKEEYVPTEEDYDCVNIISHKFQHIFKSKIPDSEDVLSIDEALPHPDDLQDTQFFKKEQSQRVREALHVLDQREKSIITLRFGLHGDEPASLTAIGRMFALTCERIRQIEKKALIKMRVAMK